MMGEYAGISWVGPGFGGIFMVLWWVLIIAGIVALARWLMSNSRSETPHKSARDILDEHYAQGEVNRDEYEVKRRDIES